MKNLGKALLKGAKVAAIGYCAYKIVDTILQNKKENEEPEEYIAFDDIPVEEPKKQDNEKIKKTIIIAGGIVITKMIFDRLNKLEDLVAILGQDVWGAYDRDLLILGGVCVVSDEKVETKIQTLFELSERATDDKVKKSILNLIKEVK